MGMGDLPDIYMVRITIMCYIDILLVSSSQSMQVCKPIVFIECEFLLTGNFQCIAKDTHVHFNCIIAGITSLPIYCMEFLPVVHLKCTSTTNYF